MHVVTRRALALNFSCHVLFQVEPGLSSFANRPSEAGESLKGLLDFALKVLASTKAVGFFFSCAYSCPLHYLLTKNLIIRQPQAVPESHRPSTLFVIAGTAGLRLVSRSVAKEILISCEKYVKMHSTFQVGEQDSCFLYVFVDLLWTIFLFHSNVQMLSMQ
jgi:Golgi nucleoside diphosphatase